MLEEEGLIKLVQNNLYSVEFHRGLNLTG